MQRAHVLAGVVAVLALTALPGTARADGESGLHVNSSMGMACLTTDCTRVKFMLSVQDEQYVGWLRIMLKNTDWRFGNVLRVEDRDGNIVNFSHAITTDSLVLTDFGAIGGEPLFLTVEMAAVGDTDQVTLFEYQGTGNTDPNWQGTQTQFNGTVALAPEPVTTLLLGTGLAGIAGVARRRRRRSGIEES